MPRPKRPAPPTPEQMPRYGIDTLYFTYKQVNRDTSKIISWLQTFIDSDITSYDLTYLPGNNFYEQGIAIYGDIEDPKQLLPPFTLISTELLRIYFDPKPQGNRPYPNDTTNIHLHGELLRRIDYHPILVWIRDNSASVTRLDLFKDDFDYLLRMDQLHDLCSNDSYAKHLQSPLVRSYLDILNGENSIYINPKGKKQVHFYNKALQMGEKFRRIRAEVKLTADNKLNTGLVKAIANGEPMEPIISSVIDNYVCFKPDGAGDIYSRDSYQWWSEFVASATPMIIKHYYPVLPAPKPQTWEKLEEKKNKLLRQLETVNTEILMHLDYCEF